MTEAPIFLAGIDRSGIGLLGELLEAHPDIAMTRRLNFWDFYADRFGDLSDPANLERCLSAMMRYSRIRRLDPDVEKLRLDLSGGEATYPQLFRLLQEQNMHRLGKRRWGDKSQGAERHAPEILTAFPTAVMLHVIRDPRDRFASQATHRSPGRGGVGSGTAAWLWSAGRARSLMRRYPGRYLAVRYEDLASEPEASLGAVCRFADIELVEAMLAGADSGALHTGSIGRYRKDLSPGDIRFVERAAGTEMRRWGYEPSGVGWTRWERARYATTRLPAAAAGLVLWRPWAVAQGLFTGRPSARRTVSLG